MGVGECVGLYFEGGGCKYMYVCSRVLCCICGCVCEYWTGTKAWLRGVQQAVEVNYPTQSTPIPTHTHRCYYAPSYIIPYIHTDPHTQRCCYAPAHLTNVKKHTLFVLSCSLLCYPNTNINAVP